MALGNRLTPHNQHHYLCIIFPSLCSVACERSLRKDLRFWDWEEGDVALVANEELSPHVSPSCWPDSMKACASLPTQCLKGSHDLSPSSLAHLAFSKSIMHLISESHCPWL